MDPTEEIAVCAGCGGRGPRSEMFGAAPDLRCQACADGIRARYDTRILAPRVSRSPAVSSFVVAVSVTLFLVIHVLRRGDPWMWWLVENERIWDGEVWRVVTSAFLHAGPAFGSGMPTGLLHLGFNAWWCFYSARAIEARWGSWALLGLVVGGAAASGAVSFMADGPGVGLSGVMYALAGFLFALRRVDATAAATMHPRAVNTLLAWFLVCVVLTAADVWSVGNWAHGAGAVWGWLVGCAVLVPWRRLAVPLAVAGTILIVAATPFVAFGTMGDLRRAYVTWRDAP